jgi:isoleucyl-tRNA synthetase
MRGRPVLWLPGTDHAGIATQLQVEKLLQEEGTTRQEVGRDEFLRRTWMYKAEQGGHITRQLRSLGASADWTRECFTMDPQLCDAVSEAFVRLHDKGLVYRGEYMVNWAPRLRTAVSDLEVEYSDEEGKLYYFKYLVENSDGAQEFLPVATTRPETIFGDTAVCVHPEDERFKHLVGKRALVPMGNGRSVPIIADDYVDMAFGTGALKITPGHDPNDYTIGKRYDLPMINIMNKDGSLNENAGSYEGLDRFVARETLWNDMETNNLVIKVRQKYLHFFSLYIYMYIASKITCICRFFLHLFTLFACLTKWFLFFFQSSTCVIYYRWNRTCRECQGHKEVGRLLSRLSVVSGLSKRKVWVPRRLKRWKTGTLKLFQRALKRRGTIGSQIFVIGVSPDNSGGDIGYPCGTLVNQEKRNM